MNTEHSPVSSGQPPLTATALLEKAIDRLTAFGVVALAIWLLQGHWEDQRNRRQMALPPPFVIVLETTPNNEGEIDVPERMFPTPGTKPPMPAFAGHRHCGSTNHLMGPAAEILPHCFAKQTAYAALNYQTR